MASIRISRGKTVRPAPANLPPSLRSYIDYRKSGLSLNHIVGCPLDCGYCVRHLFDNFSMKRPHLVVEDEVAVESLINHWAFRAHTTPIQIFNRATDPFLPGVKQHLFTTLKGLDRRGLSNPTLVITRWKIDPADVEQLEMLENLKLTVLVTWSGIDDERVEPVSSAIAARSLEVLAKKAFRTKKILYWRPIISGMNDTPMHFASARQLAEFADATVFTGVFYRDEIRDYFRQAGVPDLYEAVARRKILPRETERRILDHFEGLPIFRKTSCGIAYAHGVSDFNGHWGINELCEICPESQRRICSQHHRTPGLEQVRELARLVSLSTDDIDISEHCVQVIGSTEAQRYFMQHALNFQVHDRAQPHRQHRHGRAEIGWE
ncbi:radical SAM protein [Rhizobium leguminosarum]|uniref:radical SAM protein n=1 Tax=Rhizobium leguminosarum TaxID=384 RepID=UPI001C975B80|nr:radical SAM protein [Rhizobium leguminosarum]MBY5361895.1 radical SAM protein [Rhizobium leguminosarum]MBY5664925.1 radical SAM protein [Rhizobium leguminosarum]MBY5677591.1 radical SAM protein [Rhizobium leguminosarum]